MDRRKLSRVLQKTKFNDHCLHSCVLVTPIKNVPNEFAYLWKNWQVYGPLENEQFGRDILLFSDYRCKNSMTTDKKYEDLHIGLRYSTQTRSLMLYSITWNFIHGVSSVTISEFLRF